MRGVHLAWLEMMLESLGSSPHARGPLATTKRRRMRLRIIPACAGSTDFSSAIHCGNEDHPRMRGVHQLVAPSRTGRPGSSPHARGPPGSQSTFTLQLRIIPACAGSTGVVLSLCDCIRIIPACAGSTQPGTRPDHCYRDHPRMRGVHDAPTVKNTMTGGSSPHARGPLAQGRGPCLRPRIIPACAGSTRRKTRRKPGNWDHPRMRGVHQVPVPAIQAVPGSSPHARGPQSGVVNQVKSLGIIPACAGSTHFFLFFRVFL